VLLSILLLFPSPLYTIPPPPLFLFQERKVKYPPLLFRELEGLICSLSLRRSPSSLSLWEVFSPFFFFRPKAGNGKSPHFPCGRAESPSLFSLQFHPFPLFLPFSYRKDTEETSPSPPRIRDCFPLFSPPPFPNFCSPPFRKSGEGRVVENKILSLSPLRARVFFPSPSNIGIFFSFLLNGYREGTSFPP